MLVSKKVPFQHHDLLTVQMLERLQDHATDAKLLSYLNNPDGILSGLMVEMDEEQQVVIQPGALKWQGEIYVLAQPYVLEKLADDQLEGWIGIVPEESGLRFVVTAAPLAQLVIELGRFKSRHVGSRLRQIEQLEQLSYSNTIDCTHRKWSGADGRHTYCQQVAKCFAQALLKQPGATPLDFAFAWQALQQVPTQTMWEIYCEQNEVAFSQEPQVFISTLQQLIDKKKEPLQMAYKRENSIEQKQEQKQQKRMILLD